MFSPIGKMFIILHKLVFAANRSKTVPIIYVRIRASGLVYDTKRMTYVEDTPINIKQGFMMYSLLTQTNLQRLRQHSG